MEFKQFGNQYIVRLDKGEEIIEEITKLCAKENIKLGIITGLGATNKVKIGLFNTRTKEYKATEFNKNFEIAPLYGNISTLDSKTYLHCHINLADEDHHSFGGHLNYAYVSATFEAIIEKIEGEVDRGFNEGIGLNLYKLN